jgi:hypothetical protein
MTVETLARPELSAYDRAMRAPFPEVARELRRLLGARLVAYLGSVKETRAVHEWAEGERVPRDQTQRRLRLAFQIASTISQVDGPEVTQAWFQGLNPQLDDRSPATLLRAGDIEEVGPAVTAATRAFLSGE